MDLFSRLCVPRAGWTVSQRGTQHPRSEGVRARPSVRDFRWLPVGRLGIEPRTNGLKRAPRLAQPRDFVGFRALTQPEGAPIRVRFGAYLHRRLYQIRTARVARWSRLLV